MATLESARMPRLRDKHLTQEAALKQPTTQVEKVVKVKKAKKILI